MGVPRPAPAELLGRAFHRSEAIELGVTPRMLQHERFEQVFPSVYRLRGTSLTDVQWIDAARACLPSDARVSHLTRLRTLGLSFGPLRPLTFTVSRDLHLDIIGIQLARTVAMPPNDGLAITPAHSLVMAAPRLRVIDVVAIADWLAHRGHLRIAELRRIVEQEPWRPGVTSVRAALPHVRPRSASLPESASRVLLTAAGLPEPELNVDVHDAHGRFLARGDLVYRLWRLLVEYEGRQHAEDAAQFLRDISRYAGLREADWSYVQVVERTLRSPTAYVREVHAALRRGGYDGPRPVFGPAFNQLFSVIDDRPHRPRRR